MYRCRGWPSPNLRPVPLVIALARANAVNEEQRDQLPQAEFIRARDSDTVFGTGADFQSFPGNFTVS